MLGYGGIDTEASVSNLISGDVELIIVMEHTDSKGRTKFTSEEIKE
jgi:hypothetical protein